MSEVIALSPELEDYARLALRQHAADIDAVDLALRQRVNAILTVAGYPDGALMVNGDAVTIRRVATTEEQHD